MGNSNFITSWQEVHTIVDDAMAKGNRSVSIIPIAGTLLIFLMLSMVEPFQMDLKR